MRPLVFGLTAAMALAGCGPKEAERAESEHVVAGAGDPEAAWPVMLQHCLRGPHCDPMDNFGQGAGQASGYAGQSAWFAETREVVAEGGEDYGAAITVSLFAAHGQGGKAGRPLTIEETVSNLRGAKTRRSSLAIEYRTPGGSGPEPYGLAFSSAQLRLDVPNTKSATSQEVLADMTSAFVAAMMWPDGEAGGKVEILAKAGVVFSGYSWGLAAGDIADDGEALERGFEPWVFFIPQNIRDEPVTKLLDAIKAGETLSLRISAPDGGIILQDTIHTAGFEEALRTGLEALADPEIKRAIPERCAGFANENPEFWRIAIVTPALQVCDPRTLQQRVGDGAPGAPASPGPASPGVASQRPAQ